MKYVLVSGGVISGIGKGTLASSAGLLLKTTGLKISHSDHVDPYMNVDAGTMSPYEHGEVFVLDDGGEVDLDLGNYERYLNITLTRQNNITTGKVYMDVIEKEREGRYLGKTVQVVPHVTDAISEWIERVSRIPVDDTNEEPDVCIIELGGTVGDIESGPFIEAMRSLRRKAGKDNFLQIHVCLVPVISGEQKSKPTQQAIRDVRSAGLSPDLIACRCDEELKESTIDKVAHFCQVEMDQVLACQNVKSTYHVPILLEKQLLKSLRDILHLEQLHRSPALVAKGQRMWKEWKDLTLGQEKVIEVVKIALVGKYTRSHDSYHSVENALEHAAMHCGRKLELTLIEASDLEQATMINEPHKYHTAWCQLIEANGILVPGGFGDRATEGMIVAIKLARENKKPFFGVCLGMQLAVVEFARSKCQIQDAMSQEFDEHCKSPVILFMPDFDKTKKGGTMRLGLRATVFQSGTEWSKLRTLYGAAHGGAKQGQQPGQVLERHRHRYEVNEDYMSRLEEKGLSFVGTDESGKRMEIVEIRDHPWFVGVQFHPEYLSRVVAPSKPYLGFVAASSGCLDEMMDSLRASNASRSPDRSERSTLASKADAPGFDGPVNGIQANGHKSREP